jgi:hypothetical protein
MAIIWTSLQIQHMRREILVEPVLVIAVQIQEAGTMSLKVISVLTWDLIDHLNSD